MNALTEGYNDHYGEAAPQREEVDALKGLAVLEFGAPWCGHCQLATPFIKQMFAEHAPNTVQNAVNSNIIHHIKIYDGKGKPLGRSFAVKLWPTVIFLVDGVEVDRVVRPTSTTSLHQALRQALSPH